MDQITVFADIITIILLLVVLGGLFIQINEASGKRTALIICLIVDLFFTVFDLGVAVSIVNGIKEISGFPTVMLALANYIATLAFVNYVGEILKEKGIKDTKRLKAMKMFVGALAVIVIFLALSGDGITVSSEKVMAGTGQKICLLLLILFYLLLFLAAIYHRKFIGKVDILTFAAYMAIPAIIFVIETVDRNLHLGQLYFGFSGLFMFGSMARKVYNAYEEENLSYFKSIASSYATMHVLDLKEGLISEFGSHDPLRKYMSAHPDMEDQQIIWGILSQRVCEAHRAQIIEFTTLDTLDEKMKGLRKISKEVLNVDDKWYRFSFVRVGEIDEKLKRVIFTSHDVDTMRRSEESLKLMSTTDELTKLRNRRAFQRDIDELNEKGMADDLWYMNIDLNGLKDINDTKGHEAGDELIAALAKCISKSIYPWGNAYRIGGDEFVAIINTSKANMDVILQALETNRVHWKGHYSDTYTFSKGLVNSQEFPEMSIYELAREADRRMYEEKRAYHEKKTL